MQKTNGHKTRKTIKQALTPELTSVAMGLISISEDVATAQRHYDAVKAEFDGQTVAVSIRALSAALFPGKTPDDPLRPAANDLERKLAVEMTLQTSSLWTELRQQTEEAERNLRLARDTQENLRLVAQLMIKR